MALSRCKVFNRQNQRCGLTAEHLGQDHSFGRPAPGPPDLPPRRDLGEHYVDEGMGARTGQAFTGQALTTDVRGCARCGEDHPKLGFRRMSNPIDPNYPFWAPCPNAEGPILLMSVVEV